MKKLSQLLRASMLLVLFLDTIVTAAAYDFESGGIYYNITSSTNMTVAVTYKSKSDNNYSGNVTIPSSVSNNGKTYYVTAIGDYAFVGCSGLTGLTITSNRTTSIGSYAFQGCNGLSTFNVPAQITSIGNYAFNACYGLTKVIFNATTNAISLGYGSSLGSSHGLFEDCELTYVKIDRPLSYNTSSNYGYSPFAWQPALSQIILGQNVSSIPANLFYGNSAITSYIVPSHIKSIDDYAFNGFIGAKKITLTEGTERISNYAFNGCSSLTSFTIPSSVTSIGQNAFAGTAINSIVIPPSVTSIGNYAFNGCTALTGVTIEEGEQTLSLGYNYYNSSASMLGYGLFYDCPLNSVFIGRSLSYSTGERYGYSPFANNTSLVKAHFGNPVTSIQPYLFYGCISFKTLQYNSQCAPISIDAYAFCGCTSLTESCIVYPSSVKTIGEGAFKNCTSLLGYTIPNHVISVSTYAFQNCNKLANLVIKPSVTSIANYAFNGCISLSQLTIEEGEQTLSLGYNYYNSSASMLGCGLFYDCPLNSVFIGRSLSYNTGERYGYSPFANNTSLVKAHFGNPVTSIQPYLFYGCISFKTLQYNSQCAPISIDAYAFCGCTSLTESCIVYPSSVTTIGEGAFKNCTSLLNYTIPNHVKTINASAFQNCTKLTNISMTSVVSIGQYAFAGTAINNIVIPPSVTSIGNYAFNGCTALTGVTIEEGEQTLSLGCNYYNSSASMLGCGLFYDCPLNTVFIGRSLSYSTGERYGYSPFANNTSLVKAHFGNPVTSIQPYLFYGCISFKTLQYNSQCTPISIDAYAFCGCTSLTESCIVYPSSVKTIGEGAFKGCTSLLGYTIPNHVISVGTYAFQNCNKLANLVIKPSVTSIANYAFNGCISLSQLTIEEGEQTLSLGYNYYNSSASMLGYGLFYDCPLNSVFIGRSLSYSTGERYGYSPFANNLDLSKAKLGKKLVSISDNMFRGCIHLIEVTSCPTTPPIVGNNVFAIYDATLYVPKSSVSAYKNANVWKNFYNIVGTDIFDDQLPGDVDSDGMVNINDVVLLINYLLSGNDASVNMTNADVDGDGIISIYDLTTLIQIILKS